MRPFSRARARRFAYRLAVAGIAILHFGLVLFLVAATAALVAGLADFRPPYGRPELLYFLGIVGTATSHAVHGTCVLTTLENRLRAAGGIGPGYRESFLEHYLPKGRPRLVYGLVIVLRIGAFTLAPILIWRVVADGFG